MKTISHHIEHIKKKPHHVRKRVAFASATALTAVIALVWLASSISTGAFALKATSFAQSTGEEGTFTTSGGDASQQGLAGAAAALPSARTPTRIEIIDASPATSSKKAEQTTIPF